MKNAGHPIWGTSQQFAGIRWRRTHRQPEVPNGPDLAAMTCNVLRRWFWDSGSERRTSSLRCIHRTSTILKSLSPPCKNLVQVAEIVFPVFVEEADVRTSIKLGTRKSEDLGPEGLLEMGASTVFSYPHLWGRRRGGAHTLCCSAG